MNSRTTVLLLLVLAALGGAAWFLRPTGDVDPWAKPTENPAEARRPALLKSLGLDANQLTKITFAPAGKPGLTIVRAGDAWQLAEPFQLTLKPAQVEALLLMPLTETQDLGTAQAQAGTTQGSVDITTADRKVLRLNLGETLGAGVGALRSGDRAWRVSTHLHDLLADLPPLATLVNPQLDLPPAGRLAALTVASGQSRLRVARAGSGPKAGFTLDLPGAPRASAEAVALYCEELRKLSITEIPRETASDAAFGFDQSPVTVTLEETGGAKTQLEVGGPTGPDLKRYFIRLTPPTGAPFVAAVETALVKNLPQGAEFFRDWRVTMMKAAEVRRVRAEDVKRGVTTLDLSLDANGKVVFTDKTVPFAVDVELGKAALTGICGLKATGIAPPADFNDIMWFTKVTLTDAFGREETVFIRGSGNENGEIRRDGDIDAFKVPKEQITLLLGGPDRVRDREIRWPPNAGEITRIQLKQACGLQHEFVLKDGRWTTADHSPLEEAAVAELAKAFQHLRVKGFPRANGVPFRFDNDEKTTVPPRQNDACKTLRTEGKLLDGIFEDLLLDSSLILHSQNGQILALCANIHGGGALCTPADELLRVDFNPETIKLLQGEFRPRQLLALAPEKIAWIEIARHGGKPTLRISRGESGIYSPHIEADRPEDARNLGKLTQADCAALFDALGNLRAEQPMQQIPVWSNPPEQALQVHESNGKEHRLTLWADHRAVFGDDNTGRTFRWHGRQDEVVKAVFDKLSWTYQPPETK